MNHQDLVRKFRDGKTSGTASNMFIDGDTLYSYGHHFPLLVRMPWGYLQNGDKYSVTTSSHQSHCRHLATIIIPFSTLRAAGIDYKGEMELIDKSDARTDERTYIDKDGIKKTVYERRPESSVIGYGEKCFLSSMDGQNYFLTELPKPAKTVQAAFDMLRPGLAQGEEGKDYLRQGEWFFIPVKLTLFASYKIKTSGKGMEKQERRATWKESKDKVYIHNIPVTFLPSHNQDPHHYATEYGNIIDGGGANPFVVRGTVRHSNGEHRMLKLGNGREWYIAVESNHVRSWGASGKVD